MKRRQFMLTTLGAGVAIGASAYAPGPWTAMGHTPRGERMKRIISSPNWRDGKFQNLEPTLEIVPEASYWSMAGEYFKGSPGREPANPITIAHPSWEPCSEATLTWFGHSSYVVRWPGHTMVVDPVFNRTSPVGWAGPAPFPGMANFSVSDLPPIIDTLLITHDHYDHLDHNTFQAILPRVKRIITSLGVGEHLEYWGANPAIITELDWWEETTTADGHKITAAPARHFSGRGFKRNQTLWSGFMLELPGQKIFLGGDSGYGSHFSLIRERLGAPDLAILECGQYNPSWGYIHMLPHQIPQAAKDLGTKAFWPVHWGKFRLAFHKWLEPAITVTGHARQMDQNLAFIAPGTHKTVSAFMAEAASEQTAHWWEPLVDSSQLPA